VVSPLPAAPGLTNGEVRGVAWPAVTERERGDGHVAEEGRDEPSVSHRFARHVKAGAGSVAAAAVVLCIATGWVVLGALTDFPRWWELMATVGVPFVTLLMVVVLQLTQNHDDRATQLKLDELIRATHTATNRMMTVEDASRADLDRIHEDFQSQAESAAEETSDGPRADPHSSGVTDSSPTPG
jgi:low affinity Fe/Cu permease